MVVIVGIRRLRGFFSGGGAAKTFYKVHSSTCKLILQNPKKKATPKLSILKLYHFDGERSAPMQYGLKLLVDFAMLKLKWDRFNDKLQKQET